ncbi:MAG: hypothetical protein PHT40_01695 [Patescibacteria group bacterium]|nr:hypothetical protein [Patescibacteria group bacterium]
MCWRRLKNNFLSFLLQTRILGEVGVFTDGYYEDEGADYPPEPLSAKEEKGKATLSVEEERKIKREALTFFQNFGIPPKKIGKHLGGI